MSEFTTPPAALCEVDNGIATITLNRPEAHNTLSLAMTTSLLDATAVVERDDKVRCVVLRGAGECFAGGGDIAGYDIAIREDRRRYLANFERRVADWHLIISRLRSMPKPVLASVHGRAFGFGFSLVVAADLAIAVDDATFLLPHRHVAMTPDAGLSYFLPRLIGERRALELSLLGTPFDATKALAMGIINWMAPAEELAKQTNKIALQLAGGPPLALARTKTLLRGSFDNDWAHQVIKEAAGSRLSTASAEHVEGVGAFVAKRHPRYP